MVAHRSRVKIALGLTLQIENMSGGVRLLLARQARLGCSGGRRQVAQSLGSAGTLPHPTTPHPGPGSFENNYHTQPLFTLALVISIFNLMSCEGVLQMFIKSLVLKLLNSQP